MAHLSRSDQLGHRPDGVLDRHLRVDPVLVVEVDAVGAEPAQAGLAALLDVLRPAVDAHSASRVAADRELGRQHHLVPAAGDGPPHELLVVAGPVGVGGVEERDPELQGAEDRGQGLLLVGGAVSLRHAHAAKALCRDDQLGPAEPAGTDRGIRHPCLLTR